MQSCLQSIPDATERVYVAYSGGLDSSVLLHLSLSSELKCPLVMWHFNHGLSDAAEQMEQFCVDRAAEYGIKIRVDRLELGAIERNIEAEARQRRYRILEQNCHQGDVVLTAHHADDQAETFILNALRGSGSTGLRGIAQQRALGSALLLRPLLGSTRGQLEDYAEGHQISWFDDPTNANNRFDRNYLRNEVIPLLKQRWPRAAEALGTCSNLQSELQLLVDEVAAQDRAQVAAAPAAGLETLEIEGLKKLSLVRRKNLLRDWIAQAGFTPPPRARLEQLEIQLHADIDTCPEVAMPDYAVRIYDRRLFLVPVRPAVARRGVFEFGQSKEIKIDQYELRFEREAIFAQLALTDRKQSLSLRFRSNNEPSADKHRLKRLFQQQRIPPWERQYTILVYLDGRLQGIIP